MTAEMDVSTYDDWWTWTAATDEADPAVPPPDTDEDNDVPVPENVAVSIAHRPVNGQFMQAVGVITWDPPPRSVYSAKARYRVVQPDPEAAPFPGSRSRSRRTISRSRPSRWPMARAYEAQVRFIGPAGAGGDWSDLVPFTAVADPVAPASPVLLSATPAGSNVNLSATAANSVEPEPHPLLARFRRHLRRRHRHQRSDLDRPERHRDLHGHAGRSAPWRCLGDGGELERHRKRADRSAGRDLHPGRAGHRLADDALCDLVTTRRLPAARRRMPRRSICSTAPPMWARRLSWPAHGPSPPRPLADGTRNITAKAVAAGGATSVASNTVVTTIDTVVSPPVILDIVAARAPPTRRRTSAARRRSAPLSPCSAAASTPAGSATANGSGNWTATLSGAGDRQLQHRRPSEIRSGRQYLRRVDGADAQRPARRARDHDGPGATTYDKTPTIAGTSTASACHQVSMMTARCPRPRRPTGPATGPS